MSNIFCQTPQLLKIFAAQVLVSTHYTVGSVAVIIKDLHG